MNSSKEFTLPFLKKEQVAKDTYSFYFDRTGSDLAFLPGQYIRLTLPHENPDERGTSRFFTIASSPLEKEYLMITTKIIQSSFKKTFAGLEVGYSAKFFGPMGNFVLPEENTVPLVFLAGGIGITPFHSMLTYAALKDLSIFITFIVSFSTVEERIFFDELSHIAEEHNNIKIVYTITHPEESRAIWEGEKGRISEMLIKKYVSDVSVPIYYIVGPPALVEGMKTVLETMQIAQDKTVIENFTGY